MCFGECGKTILSQAPRPDVSCGSLFKVEELKKAESRVMFAVIETRNPEGKSAENPKP